MGDRVEFRLTNAPEDRLVGLIRKIDQSPYGLPVDYTIEWESALAFEPQTCQIESVGCPVTCCVDDMEFTAIDRKLTLTLTTGEQISAILPCFVFDPDSSSSETKSSSEELSTSEPELVWVASETPANRRWYDVAFGNGVFVAIGRNLTGDHEVSSMISEDGITWERHDITNLPANFNTHFSAITFGHGLFVAVEQGDNIATSPDGINWTFQTIVGQFLNNPAWRDVTFGDGTFIAIGSGTGQRRTALSTDGINWAVQDETILSSPIWHKIEYGDSHFMATRVFNDPPESATTSADSSYETWERLKYLPGDGVSHYYKNLLYHDGRWLAMSDANSGPAIFAYSQDNGETWTTGTMPDPDHTWNGGMASGGGNLVSMAGDDNGETFPRALVSQDGLNWTPMSTANDATLWWGVTYGNGRFVAVAVTAADESFAMTYTP